jgi:hypothetical protein
MFCSDGTNETDSTSASLSDEGGPFLNQVGKKTRAAARISRPKPPSLKLVS